MCSVFDNEEVGSGTKQGAGSTFGADVLKYNVAQKYTTDARSAAPEKAAYIYAGQIRDELGSRLDLLEKNAYKRRIRRNLHTNPLKQTALGNIRALGSLQRKYVHNSN